MAPPTLKNRLRFAVKASTSCAEQGEDDVMTGMEFERLNFLEMPQMPQSRPARQGVKPAPLTGMMADGSQLRRVCNRGYFKLLIDEMPAFGIPTKRVPAGSSPGLREVAHPLPAGHDCPRVAGRRGSRPCIPTTEREWLNAVTDRELKRCSEIIQACQTH